MQPDLYFLISPERIQQCVIAFAATGVVLILGIFIHTAASELFHITRAEKRAERLERRSQQLSGHY
jgi:hypothetical protein